MSKWELWGLRKSKNNLASLLGVKISLKCKNIEEKEGQNQWYYKNYLTSRSENHWECSIISRSELVNTS